MADRLTAERLLLREVASDGWRDMLLHRVKRILRRKSVTPDLKAALRELRAWLEGE